MPEAPTFEFDIRAVGADPTGYYFPNWDRAQKITVIAATKAEAEQTAKTMLGKEPRGWNWAIKFDRIRQQSKAGAA